MEAAEVTRIFGHVQRYRGTPCRECHGTQTVPYVYEQAVILSCEECGGATPKGRLVPRAG